MVSPRYCDHHLAPGPASPAVRSIRITSPDRAGMVSIVTSAAAVWPSSSVRVTTPEPTARTHAFKAAPLSGVQK